MKQTIIFIAVPYCWKHTHDKHKLVLQYFVMCYYQIVQIMFKCAKINNRINTKRLKQRYSYDEQTGLNSLLGQTCF